MGVLFLVLVLRERSDHYIARPSWFFAATGARDGTLVDGLFGPSVSNGKSLGRVKTKERVFLKNLKKKMWARLGFKDFFFSFIVRLAGTKNTKCSQKKKKGKGEKRSCGHDDDDDDDDDDGGPRRTRRGGARTTGTRMNSTNIRLRVNWRRNARKERM